jgi:peptidoglycan/LPS O-acetylase OafA/YrhL
MLPLAYRPDIDGLRAIAVLAVLGFHAFPWAVPGGFIGVDVFFVISGYLISSILYRELQEKTFSFSQFYARRIRRIFPALILVLIVCMGVGWFCLLPADYAKLGKHTAASALFVSNFFYWQEAGYFDGSASSKPLLHLWSLGVEEQFYILWPFIIWGAWHLRQNLLLVTTIVALGSFTYNLYDIFIAQNSVAAFYSPQTRFWELMLGAILAHLNLWAHPFFRVKQNALFSHSLSILGTLCLGLGLVFISKGLFFPGLWALLPTLGALLLIAAGPEGLINRILLKNKLLVGIGLISYPLYLWHWVLLSWEAILLAGSAPSNIQIWVVLGSSVLLASLTYWLIEKPIRTMWPKVIVTRVLIGMMVILMLMGVAVNSRNGYKERFPPAMWRLMERGVTERDSVSIDAEFNEWHENSMRVNKCFLESDKVSTFSSECFEEKRPLIALIGDSHAAAFYTGLKKLSQGNDFGIIELTQQSCQPIFGVTQSIRRQCDAVNREIFQELIKRQPELIILMASWKNGNSPFNILDFEEQLDNTLFHYLRYFSPKQIIIIGPIPGWEIPLNRFLLRKWLQSSNKIDLPQLYQPALFANEFEQVIELVSHKYGVGYISAKSLLCKENLCITRVYDDQLISIDASHLSPRGSEYFADLIKDEIYIRLNKK